MRMWYQVVSSETKMRSFLDELQRQCNGAASEGTIVEVHGTEVGALGDNYRLPFNYDVRDIITNALKVRRSGDYDAFLIGNSLEPAVVELREVMDIPVLTFMESACLVSCMMGERFGIIAPNKKMVPRYREIPVSFGLRDRMATVEWVEFNDIWGMNRIFAEKEVGDAAVQEITAAARRCIAGGAEVIIAAGPLTTILAKNGVREIDEVPLLDVPSLLVTMGEMMAKMKKITGTHISRKLLYQSPPPELLAQAAKLRNIPV